MITYKTVLKIRLILLFICATNQIFSQQSNSKKSIKPKTYIVVDNKTFPLTDKASDKLEMNWILTVSVPTEENLKNGKPILYYANNKYKENIYEAIGLKEDNNVYTTLNSYADFKYKSNKTMEESIEAYFKENYKVPEKLRKKKYWWKVYISAIVEKNGSLSNISVNANNANSKITPSIIEFIKQMPAWIPAEKNDEKVRSKCIFGVYFEWFNEK